MPRIEPISDDDDAFTPEPASHAANTPRGDAWLFWIAVLLWPAASIWIDLLGDLGLDRISPRRDFGLAVSGVSIPLCYLASVTLLWVWAARVCRDWSFFPLALVLTAAYTLGFGVWTFLTFPFGRISEDF